jgi:hypothetical protein
MIDDIRSGKTGSNRRPSAWEATQLTLYKH